MSTLTIKTPWIALVYRHSGEKARIVELLAESKEDAERQLEWCLDVVWLRENGVHKEAA